MSKTFFSAGWCRAVLLYMIIFIIGLLADLATKHFVFQSLGMPGTYKAENEPELNAVHWIWQNAVGFQTSLNTGALFGLGAGNAAVLAILSFIFLAGVMIYLVLWAWRSLFLSVILGLISAGICGNLYDRLGLHGLTWNGEPIYAVRDWILVMIGTYPWPNFNIADSLLVCSVILLLLHGLFFDEKKTQPSATA